MTRCPEVEKIKASRYSTTAYLMFIVMYTDRKSEEHDKIAFRSGGDLETRRQCKVVPTRDNGTTYRLTSTWKTLH
jgi:hypothetical protein